MMDWEDLLSSVSVFRLFSVSFFYLGGFPVLHSLHRNKFLLLYKKWLVNITILSKFWTLKEDNPQIKS